MMASLLSKTEVNRAQFGPRELKDPRSRDYAIQTLYALKRYSEMLHCDRELVVKELEEIERYRHWEVLGYASREAMLAAELNEQGVQNVELVLQRHGGDRKSAEVKLGKQDQGSNATLIGRGSTYTLARLRRDAPELAQRVMAGELTANAAAIEAGFRKRTWNAPVEVEALADALIRKLGAEKATELCEVLARKIVQGKPN